MPGQPAARVTDFHMCSMTPVPPGLPIIPPTSVNVLIGGLPAARQTDRCACVGPPPVPVDAIVFGSPTVHINKLPAARMGDPTAKGGAITTGCLNVLIGLFAVVTPAFPTVAVGPVVMVTGPDGNASARVGKNMTIEGSPEFIQRTLDDLAIINATKNGNSLLGSILGSAHPVTIRETADGNSVEDVGPQGWLQNDGAGPPGTGSGSTVNYNPNREQIYDGSEDWMTRPPAVALAHELVHVEQAQNGTWSDNETDGTLNDELQAVGLPPYENHPHTENRIRDQMGQPQRPYY